MIWRIVRINGDETIRIALTQSVDSSNYDSHTSNKKYVGYTYYRIATETDSIIKAYVDNWYYNSNGRYSNLDKLVVTTKFCSDTSIIDRDNHYGTYAILQINKSAEPNFTCPTTNKPYVIDIS